MFALRHAQRSLTDARQIHENADRDNRDLTTEERSRYDDLMGRARQYAVDAEVEAEAERNIAKYNDPTRAAQFFNVVTDKGRTPSASVERRAATPQRETTVLLMNLGEYRAQAEGIDSAGGVAVPTEQSPVIVDRLGPESVLLSAGPRLFTMSSDEMRIPMIATGVTVHFVAENQPIPESDIVFAAALLQARKVAALTRASSEWMSDAIPEARPVVEQNHFREMGIKIDAAFFNGSGVAPELLGILNWSGVTKTPGTASLDDIAAAIGRVEAANAVPNAIFISPQNWSAIRVERDGGATGGYVLSPDASEAARARVFGVPVYVTPHVGTSIVVADMRSIAVGVRDRWLVLYDTYRYLEFDQVSIRTTSRWAIAPLHVAGVQIITTGVAAAEAETPNGTKDAAARAEAARKAEAEAARHTGRK